MHLLKHAGEQCHAGELAAALSLRGYAVRVVKSAGGGSGTAAFRNLRHTSLLVALPSGGEPLVVDAHFACQFRLSSPTPRFAALSALLPRAFVGTREQLGHVVEWVCRCDLWLGQGWAEVGLLVAGAGSLACMQARRGVRMPGSSADGSPPPRLHTLHRFSLAGRWSYPSRRSARRCRPGARRPPC